MTNLVAFHRFILECAEDGLSDGQFLWLLTDIIYMHLFGMDGDNLRTHFNLPLDADDDDVRDRMEVDALSAVMFVEQKGILALNKLRGKTQTEVLEIVWKIAEKESKRIKEANPDFSLTSGGTKPNK